MTPEQFAELFKQSVQQGYIKIELESDDYFGNKSVELKISDKQGETIFQREVQI